MYDLDTFNFLYNDIEKNKIKPAIPTKKPMVKSLYDSSLYLLC